MNEERIKEFFGQDVDWGSVSQMRLRLAYELGYNAGLEKALEMIKKGDS